MSMKAVSEKLMNPNTLLKIGVKDATEFSKYKLKQLTPEQKEAFVKEMQHAEEVIAMHEAAGIINKAMQKIKK